MNRLFHKLGTFLKARMSRGAFLKLSFGVLAYFVSENTLLKLAYAKAPESGMRKKRGTKGDHDLVIVEGTDPYTNTVRAIEAMGGMGRFVRSGDVVVVKPNMAWDRTPEQAGNTEPAVVAALVELCYKAGAKRVDVFDVPCNDEKRVHVSAGIAAAARSKGANVFYVNHWNTVKARFPYDSPMEGWPVLRDAMDSDVFINVPILKHHCLTELTLSMKNLMGVCSGDRGQIHVDIGRKLVDLTEFVAPDLTVIDATRVLMRHGPSGGDLADVVRMDKIIVATDPTLADVFAATLVKVDPMSVPYIRVAAERKIGNSDITKADILKISA